MSRGAKMGGALLLVLVILGPSLAWGDARVVKPGDVITEDGIFLPAKDALEAAEMLARYKGLVDQVAAMDQKLKDQGEEIDNLVRQMGSSERELAIKDMVIKLKDEMLTFRKELNDEYRMLLSESRKQMENDRETIKRLEAKIEAQAKRGFWATIGTFILGLAMIVSHGLL
jgi:hypothetical protein